MPSCSNRLYPVPSRFPPFFSVRSREKYSCAKPQPSTHNFGCRVYSFLHNVLGHCVYYDIFKDYQWQSLASSYATMPQPQTPNTSLTITHTITCLLLFSVVTGTWLNTISMTRRTGIFEILTPQNSTKKFGCGEKWQLDLWVWLVQVSRRY